MNKISFIGAGKVGTSFGKYLAENGSSVCGYCSRTQKSAENSAEFVGCRAYISIFEAIDNADIIFITVGDDDIANVDKEIGDCLNSHPELCGKQKLFCHTSGVHSSAVLAETKACGCACASAHMMLAVNDKYKSFESFNNAFFTLEGDCGKIQKILEKCGNKYAVISSASKPKYHAAAVFASNFVCALCGIAEGLLTECGFDEEGARAALAPLILNNAQNIADVGAEKALTGPAARGDLGTIGLHEKALADNKKALDVYRIMTEIIKHQTLNTEMNKWTLRLFQNMPRRGISPRR